MSDIHVITGNGLDNWTLLFHYAVPDINNEVSVNYRTALINGGLGGTSTMAEGVGAGEISTAELALIATGALYEHSISFLAESGATNNAEIIAEVQALYTASEAQVIDRLKRQLKYYGYTGDVP
ncbi:hypothetical protein LCGC14_2331490 [marine sediment metagenome]|uniref:Uncharacterized protein n=1 Tax=marine sediment metagenome TaxID=412755 RepID=A0A0F9CEQ6_9ZZZZ